MTVLAASAVLDGSARAPVHAGQARGERVIAATSDARPPARAVPDNAVGSWPSFRGPRASAGMTRRVPMLQTVLAF